MHLSWSLNRLPTVFNPSLHRQPQPLTRPQGVVLKGLMMRNLKRWVLFGSVAVVLCVSALVNLSSPVSSQGNRKGVKLPTGLPPLENFDIRAASRNAEPESESPTVKGKASSNTLMSLERPKQAFSSPSIRALQKSMRSAQERLSKSVPNLRVVYNDTARVPEA